MLLQGLASEEASSAARVLLEGKSSCDDAMVAGGGNLDPQGCKHHARSPGNLYEDAYDLHRHLRDCGWFVCFHVEVAAVGLLQHQEEASVEEEGT